MSIKLRFTENSVFIFTGEGDNNTLARMPPVSEGRSINVLFTGCRRWKR